MDEEYYGYYMYLWIENGEERNYIIMSGAAARTLMERKKL